MIDNIKIVVPNAVISQERLEDFYTKHPDKNRVVKTFKLFLSESRGENDPFLNVEIDEAKKKLTISGSLRKWRTTKSNAISDLTKEKFENCIEKIAYKLDVPLEIILNGNVTKVEIGASIKMDSKYRYILSCIDNFPKLKKETFERQNGFVKNSKELETLYFLGTNFSLMFYNKLEEVFSPVKKSKEALSKLSKNLYVLRYELKVNKVSGYLLKDKINTVGKILDNWNEIIDHWVGRLDELTFIDNLSAEDVHFKKEMKLSELKELLIYQGISTLGWDNVRVLVNDFGTSKKVSQFRKDLKNIWEKNRGIEKRNYIDVLKSEIEKRGGNLKVTDNP